ncbi:ribbon-helix-helix protein, CopG family [Gluconobacter cerevisiae]|uniref:Ribbon-helix-helix protein, CopG family n=1 Tax=Gluconobacter cerevisiae TaxID=1379734 RepID=A0ABR9YF48_9PROT|nr:ribbon-helix-helix protein, CopG family [Gluconobacter cerevisiae]MBF0877290.1 ribbon-helix-helix protein, CopG family [Gluconobacter cerevisiae]
MSNAISVHQKKKRGRPPENGRDPLISTRMPEQDVAALEAWAAAHNLSRSEAIRRLIQKGLDSEKDA